RDATKSSRVFVPISDFDPFSPMKLSIQSVSRFQTATAKPCSSAFKARFLPITPSPIIPNWARFTCACSVAISTLLLLIPRKGRLVRRTLIYPSPSPSDRDSSGLVCSSVVGLHLYLRSLRLKFLPIQDVFLQSLR